MVAAAYMLKRRSDLSHSSVFISIPKSRRVRRYHTERDLTGTRTRWITDRRGEFTVDGRRTCGSEPGESEAGYWVTGMPARAAAHHLWLRLDWDSEAAAAAVQKTRWRGRPRPAGGAPNHVSRDSEY